MPELLALIAEAVSATARVAEARGQFAGLSDDQLMEAQRRLAAVDRHATASAAAAAGEVEWRSRPELGYAGLARRTGARTPQSLVQQLTGSTGRHAAELVRVGKIMQEAEQLPPSPVAPGNGTECGVDPEPMDGGQAAAPEPTPWNGTGTAWLAPAGRAVAAGLLPVAAADAIRMGLGSPSDAVTVAQLTAATQRLVEMAATMNVDQLLKRARAVRDEIDAAGIAEREEARHAARSFKIWKRSDGFVVGDFALPVESGGAEVLETFELITSPRRGGPRFVDKDEQARSQRLLDDERSTEQIQADAFVQLMHAGAAADPTTLIGTKKPAVRLLTVVEPDELSPGAGTAFGRIEGHSDPVSAETVDRSICDSGTIAVMFDADGQVLNLGREQRLYTTAQRIALAARDGGCRFPGCERPPSWCEAHHCVEWHRHRGRTDIADGILLCRHHHLLIHNNHWQIKRDGAEYLLIPPKERDPSQTPIEMPPKSAALADLYRRKRAG